jgi:hypothetical protein
VKPAVAQKEKENKEKDRASGKEKDFKELSKKLVEPKETLVKEEKKEFKLPASPAPMPTKPAPAQQSGSVMSDIWEIPAFLRKKRRDNP